MNHQTNKKAKIPYANLCLSFCRKIWNGRGLKYVSIEKQLLCHQKCCGRRAYCYTDFSMVPDRRLSTEREYIRLFPEVRVEGHHKGPRNHTQSRGSEMESINCCHIGGINSSISHPGEFFKAAVLSNAASILVGHNHPSGLLIVHQNSDV